MVMQFLKYRRLLFTTEFQHIKYFVPEKHLMDQQDFLAEMKRICPEIQIKPGEPTFADVRQDKTPKLLILGKLGDILVNQYFNQ